MALRPKGGLIGNMDDDDDEYAYKEREKPVPVASNDLMLAQGSSEVDEMRLDLTHCCLVLHQSRNQFSLQ